MIIAPSILNGDWADMGRVVRDIEEAGADWLHLDIMDGRFVPNISFGPGMVAALRPHTRLLFDVHLMIEEPQRYIGDFAAAGADSITIHAEADRHAHRALQAIRALGKKAGIALNPGTHESAIIPLLDEADIILCMTVNPGFGGQKLIPAALEKLARLRGPAGRRGIILQVDGGISDETAARACAAGAGSLVVGTWLIGAPDRTAAMARLRAAAEDRR